MLMNVSLLFFFFGLQSLAEGKQVRTSSEMGQRSGKKLANRIFDVRFDIWVKILSL